MSKANLVSTQEDKSNAEKEDSNVSSGSKTYPRQRFGAVASFEETLKRMERAGRLPALKIGRSVRYRLADIERIEAESAVR
jgi:DNA-binding transcriptional regulator PaaX